MTPLYLGIEIGGTKLQLGVGASGRLLGSWRGTVDEQASAAGIRRQIEQAVPELLGRVGVRAEQLRGVGIGFGGPVDDASQTVIASHQIAGWNDFPLAEWIGELVARPAILGNDADVAGLAEALHGAGKGLSPIFYITLGSGIGGGLIIQGEIFRGCGRGAAEIGHLRVNQRLNGSGSLVDLERVSSGWGIEAEDSRRSAAEIAAAARRGDVHARTILDRAWEALAEAICQVIALLCPRRIVIGGGVSLMGEELLFVPLRQKVSERVFTSFAGLTDIVPAALGEEVVLHGAIALAQQKLP